MDPKTKIVNIATQKKIVQCFNEMESLFLSTIVYLELMMNCIKLIKFSLKQIRDQYINIHNLKITQFNLRNIIV